MPSNGLLTLICPFSEKSATKIFVGETLGSEEFDRLNH
jgi:hypothetical protein